jgi:hypothetical protein
MRMMDSNGEVDQAETILWQGSPRTGFVWRWEWSGSIAAGLAVGTGAVYIAVGLLRGGFDWYGAVICGIFTVVAIYLTAGVILLDIFDRRSTHYLVTDRRVIIRSRLPFLEEQSVPLFRVDGRRQQVNMTSDGSLSFGRLPVLGNILRFWGPLYRALFDDPRMDCLEEPMHVYRLIREAQKAAKTL